MEERSSEARLRASIGSGNSRSGPRRAADVPVPLGPGVAHRAGFGHHLRPLAHRRPALHRPRRLRQRVPHQAALAKWKTRVAEAEKAGKKKPGKPPIELPEFVTFIRTPLCASFHIDAKPEPLEFIAIAAHLLYGTSKVERQWEFDALMGWVLERARHADRMYYPDMLVLGNMNLFFEGSWDCSAAIRSQSAAT